ncbi:isocitrate/isopropylmalate family dehydrogenase, partial [Staphylococcus epidermidis]|uniref:isocitrate/isopropylmalate family dehydrogenase n=1 Tax=Staphylococcus epidermidis TaxID=1282 RepID=UPI0028CBA6B7
MTYKILPLPPHPIPPHILSATLQLLKLITQKYHFQYHFQTHHFPPLSIHYYPTPLTNQTLQSSKNPHPILLPAIPPPKSTHPNNPPQHPFLKLTKSLNLFPSIPP